MGIETNIKLVLLICCTFLSIVVINGDDAGPTTQAPAIGCTQHNTSDDCCQQGADTCWWVEDCTNATDAQLPAGCWDFDTLNKTCKERNFTNSCSNVESGCAANANETSCCADDAGCSWISCTDKAGKLHTGCHNSTNKEEINAVCDEAKPINDACAEADSCTTYKNQSECCNHTTEGCSFFNCTDTDKKVFKGCFNMSSVTCTDKQGACSQSTTPTPTTTTTTVKPTTAAPLPDFKKCEHYTNSGGCCNSQIFNCIYINCTGKQDKKMITGCFSLANQTYYQGKCQTYKDFCQTPAPTQAPSPASGGDTRRHFDGASFIGGIVLCAGIVVLIFIGLKWYRSRKAGNNYHQM